MASSSDAAETECKSQASHVCEHVPVCLLGVCCVRVDASTQQRAGEAREAGGVAWAQDSLRATSGGAERCRVVAPMLLASLGCTCVPSAAVCLARSIASAAGWRGDAGRRGCVLLLPAQQEATEWWPSRCWCCCLPCAGFSFFSFGCLTGFSFFGLAAAAAAAAVAGGPSAAAAAAGSLTSSVATAAAAASAILLDGV